MAPRETENNAYAKFWGDKQRTLWYVMVFLEWSMAANEGVINAAVVNFYQDDSDAVFLGLSYDLRPNSLKVQILIGLLVGNVGLWPVKKFVEESNTRFEKWRAT